MEWLTEYLQTLTLGKVLLGVGIFLFSFVLSFLAIGIVMVKIPADYFSTNYKQRFMPDKVWYVRWSVVIIKNVFGVFLIILGLLLSLPGVPGQGILTILLGLIMIDIPGKRPLEAKIIKRPTILSAVNKLRKRYDKPELILD
ncbi:MAG: hypothetical protein M3405_12615 [Acidobacteriota bacterium]|jgi:multisubunit Na+/H+ antiporter MnhG subunit|nr:hypothetical protein [Acidobacteriota bacterium]